MQYKPTQQNSRKQAFRRIAFLLPIVARGSLVTVRIRSGNQKGVLIQNNSFVRMLFGSCSVNLR